MRSKSHCRLDKMKESSITLYSLALTLLVVFEAVAQTAPISLDRFSQRQRLYMLDESGRILVSDQAEIDVPIRVLARVPSTLKALDILSAKLWGDREMAFVTAYGLTVSDSRSRLIQYSAIGEQQCEWMLPEVSSGLDVDTDKHIIYLSGSVSGTVYRLRLIKDKCYESNQLNVVMQIKGARRLGPIVVDSEDQVAFVADVLNGSLYRLDLARQASVEFVRSLGQPVALLYDGHQVRIYSADSAGRRIWRIEVAQFPAATPVVISRDPALQEPSSLAFSSGGQLLVGDRKAKAIFTIDWAGKVVNQHPIP
jgi:hypothetical protein